MEILIVGAGAAGLMAAGAALERGHAVTLLEHSPRPGQKLLSGDDRPGRGADAGDRL